MKHGPDRPHHGEPEISVPELPHSVARPEIAAFKHKMGDEYRAALRRGNAQEIAELERKIDNFLIETNSVGLRDEILRELAEAYEEDAGELTRKLHMKNVSSPEPMRPVSVEEEAESMADRENWRLHGPKAD